MAERTPEPGYDALLHFCCVRLGYCGSVKDGEPLHVDMFIPEAGAITADQFVDWMFRAEQLDPASDERLQAHGRAIRAAFVEHMGAEVVDAEALRWSFEK